MKRKNNKRWLEVTISTDDNEANEADANTQENKTIHMHEEIDIKESYEQKAPQESNQSFVLVKDYVPNIYAELKSGGLCFWKKMPKEDMEQKV